MVVSEEEHAALTRLDASLIKKFVHVPAGPNRPIPLKISRILP
jgi:hypothetical protein